MPANTAYKANQISNESGLLAAEPMYIDSDAYNSLLRTP